MFSKYISKSAAMTACSVFCVSFASIRGQTGQPVKPLEKPSIQFDVATIKPMDPSGRGLFGPNITADGRVMVGHTSVRMLVGIAFDVDEWQVTGGPDWADKTRYDILGVPPDAARFRSAKDRYSLKPVERQMLQSLLIERFGLQFHRVVKTGPVFLLTRGSGTLELHEPKDKDREPAGDMIRHLQGTVITADGEAFGMNITMAEFARYLSPDLGQLVLDRTGIAGAYDFHVEPFDPGNPDVTLMAIGAMQRLGLKLTATKGPVETIVIDSATFPTPN